MTPHPPVSNGNSSRHRASRHRATVLAPLCLVALWAVSRGLMEPATATEGDQSTLAAGDSGATAQRPLLHGFYHVEWGGISPPLVPEGLHSAGDVTEVLRNLSPSGLPMPPDSVALIDRRSRILYLHSCQQAHTEVARKVEAETFREPTAPMVMEARAYKLDPTTEPRPPTVRLLDSLRDGTEPGTRLFSTEQAVRSASRTSVEFGVHPSDREGEDVVDDALADPSDWVSFGVDPLWWPTANPESVQVLFQFTTISPGNAHPEPGQRPIDVAVGGELAGRTGEWLTSRHRTNDIDVLVMIRFRIDE